jgi:hypothetical protein
MAPRQASQRRVGQGQVVAACTLDDEFDLHSSVESLLRDLALVLHATHTIRRDMEAGQAGKPAIS